LVNIIDLFGLIHYLGPVAKLTQLSFLDQLFQETKREVNFQGEHHYWVPKDNPESYEAPDFPELKKVADKMHALGVDSTKMAIGSRKPADVAVASALSHYLQAGGRKSTVLAMQEIGESTRFNPNNEMTFAPVDPKKKTAPGQHTVDEMCEIFEERFGLV
jgi:3-dehydroquinate dehydratase